MKSNSELLNEFMNSKGDSKKMWKLLYTELLYNDSDLNSNIIFEINKCLSNNKNFDLILDIIDFCLVYGKKEIIDKILACLELNGFFYLNSNKGKKTNENTAKKIFYLIKKWSDILGNNFPKFKEMYKKISKYNNFFKNIKEIKTYLKFISEEDISDEKFIFEFYNQLKNEGDNSDDGDFVPPIDFDIKNLKNIDNNGSLIGSTFCLLNDKKNGNNLPNMSKISHKNNADVKEIKFIEEKNNINNINTNIKSEKENKNNFIKKEKNENNADIINQNNNISHKRNNTNNGLKNINIFNQNLQNENKQMNNNNINNNNDYNLFGNASKKISNVNINFINNNSSNNYIIENLNAPNFFTLSSNCNNDDDNLKNNDDKLNSNESKNSDEKKYTNYFNNDSELKNINLKSFKDKIELEVKNLNSLMNENSHDKNINDLKINVNNLRKELSTCDNLIYYYKNNNKNNEKADIAENIKKSILKLISRYDEFIKNNSEHKDSKSSFNKNK